MPGLSYSTVEEFQSIRPVGRIFNPARLRWIGLGQILNPIEQSVRPVGRIFNPARLNVLKLGRIENPAYVVNLSLIARKWD